MSGILAKYCTCCSLDWVMDPEIARYGFYSTLPRCVDQRWTNFLWEYSVNQESITTFHSKTKHHNSVTLTRALSRGCLLCQWIFELLGQSLRDFKAALQTHHISINYLKNQTRSANFSQENPINDLDYIDQTSGLQVWIKFSTFGAVKGVLSIIYRPEPELLDRLCAMLPNSEKNEKSYNEYERIYIPSPSMSFTGYTTAG